jgi:exopolysaccharide biosynthesis polyprenyl glycosylphosphotransferase
LDESSEVRGAPLPSWGRPHSRRSDRGVTPSRRRTQLGRVLAVGDAVVIAVASGLAYAARELAGRATAVQEFANEVPVALAVIPMWLALFYLAGAYRPEYLNAGGDSFRRFVAGVSGGVLALGFISFLFNLQLARLFVLFLSVAVFVGGGLLRLQLRRSLQLRQARGELLQRALVAGTDADARQLVDALRSSNDSSYRVVGYLDETLDFGQAIEDIPVVARPVDVLRACAEHEAGVVIASPAGLSPGTLRDLTIALEGTEVDLAVAPSLVQVVTRRMTIETVGGVPILHVDQIRLTRGKALLKRSLDVAVAAALLMISLPVWLLVALAIRLDTPGPVLFRQERIGRDGQPFTMLKLRTMVADAEKRLPELNHLNEAEGHFFKISRDPRVTRVGCTLRRWSIDELPQLLNVLRGEMSMVGPRPPLPHEVAAYDAWHLRRLRVRPGVTGVWQVSGRSDVPFDQAVRLDLFYIENWSLGYDLYLLGRTFGAVLSRRGAW